MYVSLLTLCCACVKHRVAVRFGFQLCTFFLDIIECAWMCEYAKVDRESRLMLRVVLNCTVIV